MPRTIQSVERAVALLQLVAEQPRRLGLTELSTLLGLAKPTTHGLLRTLAELGFLTQDPGTGRYDIGRAALDLAAGPLDPNDLRSHAFTWSDSLATRSGEAVRLAVLDGMDALVVHHVFRPDDTRQTLETGTRLPAHATALGKVLLAWGVPTAARRGDDLERHTQHTVTSARVLARVLVDVRRAGWAAEVEEHRIGVASVAAPVHGMTGRVVGAIAVSGSLDRICDSRRRPRSHLVDQVLATARDVSRDILTARRARG